VGLGWALSGADAARVVEIVVAVLVVTCPCALGIAAPLAHELGVAALRRRGVFVRSPSFLDRASDVRTLIFDKTGTLTLGTLRLVDVAPIAALSPADRQALFDMAIRSRHPKSLAIVTALEPFDCRVDETASVTETPGRGLTLDVNGCAYRLGAPAWAGEVDGTTDVVFGKDGTTLAALHTEEHIRPDAASALARLRSAGFEIHVASGDDAARASSVAARLGIPEDHVLSAATPEEKEALVARLDHGDTLMIGDGVNDARAAARAHASGTPASHLPHLTSRTDFFVEGRLVEGVEAALEWARRVRKVVHHDLAFAVSYNVIVVALAAAGLMTPLLCAVVMPLSSVVIVAFTTRSLSITSRTRAREESSPLAPRASLEGT
jgi:Cu2+-exporting ATPase